MSSVKRRRNPNKKFIDKDEENEVGVTDQPNGDMANKIEEKQKDALDAHKLKQNILRESDKSYQNNFIDFGDEDIVQDPPQKNEQSSAQSTFQQQKKEEEEPTPKKNNRKQRGRREKKMIDSDEDVEVKEEPSDIKRQENFSDLMTVEEGNKMIKGEESLGRAQYQQEQEQEQHSEQQEKREQETIQGMVAKKVEQKPNDNYVFMHNILGKAGFNKAERKAAIYAPLAQGQHSFVYFKRYASGFSEYYQAIGQDQRPILFCENQRGCIGCNYYISLTKEMDKNNPAYLGKLRGNAAGSIYQLYDFGAQPNSDIDRSKWRVSMAYVQYESNFLGMKGPRKLKAVIPRIRDTQDFDMYKLTEEESLNNFQPPIVINLRNKQPRWNDRLKSYALNFGGRVKQASIKNFILMDDSIDPKDQDRASNLIVFGKIDENTFALEFRHPLNLFQAFGIAMSEFDFKLKCE